MNAANKASEIFVAKASAKGEQKTSEAANIIDEQLDVLKKQMEQKSQQVNDYKTKTVHALPEHIEDNIKAVTATREQIQSLETKIAEEQAKKSSAEHELQD